MRIREIPAIIQMAILRTIFNVLFKRHTVVNFKKDHYLRTVRIEVRMFGWQVSEQVIS
jgi:hypothetical protein